VYSFIGDYSSLTWAIWCQWDVSVRGDSTSVISLSCCATPCTSQSFKTHSVSSHTLRWQGLSEGAIWDSWTVYRCLFTHVTKWRMLGGPHVYSFYTTATIAVVKPWLLVMHMQAHCNVSGEQV